MIKLNAVIILKGEEAGSIIRKLEKLVYIQRGKGYSAAEMKVVELKEEYHNDFIEKRLVLTECSQSDINEILWELKEVDEAAFRMTITGIKIDDQK